MSGKPRKTNGWGGKRPNQTGRPAYMITDNLVRAMLRTARKKAKEQGKTLDDILLDIIYNMQAHEVEFSNGRKKIVFDVETRDRISAIKLFKDFTMTKSTEQTINKNINKGPAIGLPKMKQDPAKLISIDGGRKTDG